jgi:hypothetical protein
MKLFGAAAAVATSVMAFGSPALATPVPIPAGKCDSGWLCLYSQTNFGSPKPEISRSNHCVPVSGLSKSIINNSNRTYYAYATSACGGLVARIYPFTANNNTTVAFSSVDTVIHT